MYKVMRVIGFVIVTALFVGYFYSQTRNEDDSNRLGQTLPLNVVAPVGTGVGAGDAVSKDRGDLPIAEPADLSTEPQPEPSAAVQAETQAHASEQRAIEQTIKDFNTDITDPRKRAAAEQALTVGSAAYRESLKNLVEEELKP